MVSDRLARPSDPMPTVCWRQHMIDGFSHWRSSQGEAPPPAGRCPVLVGGVGPRRMGDASFGPLAVDTMARDRWPSGTQLLDLSCGPADAAECLLATPVPYRKAILLAGVPRGRPPGRLYQWRRRGGAAPFGHARTEAPPTHPAFLDQLVETADRFGVLPREVIIMEVEPVRTEAAGELSPAVARLLPEALRRVREEIETAVRRMWVHRREPRMDPSSRGSLGLGTGAQRRGVRRAPEPDTALHPPAGEPDSTLEDHDASGQER